MSILSMHSEAAKEAAKHALFAQFARAVCTVCIVFAFFTYMLRSFLHIAVLRVFVKRSNAAHTRSAL